jgi:hypothetical protein
VEMSSSFSVPFTILRWSMTAPNVDQLSIESMKPLPSHSEARASILLTRKDKELVSSVLCVDDSDKPYKVFHNAH